jgi:hypothetical protein
LSQEQFEWLKTAIANWLAIQETLRQMQRLSREELFTALPNPRRRKQLSKEVRVPSARVCDRGVSGGLVFVRTVKRRQTMQTQITIGKSLELVRQELDTWRASRTKRSAVSEPLWNSAVELARTEGVNAIARALRLNYYGLKRRMGQSIPGAVQEKHSGFVELRVNGPVRSVGCTVRMERPGAKMTLEMVVAGVAELEGLCERGIKKAIRHRKNSLFFKTPIGAQVGDLFISLIHTCEFNAVNPFDYLTTLRQNFRQVKEKPELWLPWNFLKACDTS